MTEGTFGPILNTVMVDAAHSTTEWSRWEAGAERTHGSFSLPGTASGVPLPGFVFYLRGRRRPWRDGVTAYHGEFGIDPHSGTILRLVLQADPDPGSSMQRADIMVEYGAVMIGGKGYTCPVRSVSIAAGVSPMELSATLYVTRLDDVVFSGYTIPVRTFGFCRTFRRAPVPNRRAKRRSPSNSLQLKSRVLRGR